MGFFILFIKDFEWMGFGVYQEILWWIVVKCLHENKKKNVFVIFLYCEICYVTKFIFVKFWARFREINVSKEIPKN